MSTEESMQESSGEQLSSAEVKTVLNDQEKELFMQAEDHFLRNQFESCSKCLQNLIDSFQQRSIGNQQDEFFRNNELKLLLNKSLCELGSSEFSQLDELNQELNRLSSSLKLDLGKTETLDDSNFAFLFYNYAVYLYFKKQYSKSLRIIDKLYYQFNELLDVKLLKNVSLIHADLLVQLRQPTKALTVLQNFEKSTLRRQSMAKAGEEASNQDENEANNDLSSSNETHNYQQLVSLFKLKCYFQMNNREKYETELSTLNNLCNQSQKANRQQLSHLKSKEKFLQNDFLSTIRLLLGEFISSLPPNVPSTALNFVQELNSIAQNEFKSNHTFLNLFKSTQLLVKQLGNLNMEQETAQLFNNLALVHFNLKKYSTSSLYLQKSLQENAKLLANTRDSRTKSQLLMQNRQYEILYNLGVSLLFSKQALSAFECFQKLIQIFSNNSRLWLRMAECCIVCYKHSLPDDAFVSYSATVSGNEKIFKLSEKIKCIKRAFGHGFHHKIQIESALSTDYNYTSLKMGDLGHNKNAAELISLEYALICLKNALRLLPTNDKQFLSCLKASNPSEPIKLLDDNGAETEHEQEEAIFSPDANSMPKNPKLFNCVWPSKPLNLTQLQSLRSSILVSLSYVSLCLGDYLSTMRYASMLLDVNDAFNQKCPIANGTRYLAHSYLAEAQLNTDCLNESIENLNANAKLESDLDISFMPASALNQAQANQENETDENQSIRYNQTEWYPKDANNARAITHFNLCVTHAIRGETEVAYKHFKTSVSLFSRKQPSYIFYMKMYLDLLDGNRQSLQEVLKDHFSYTTLNQTTNLNSLSNFNAINNSAMNNAATTTAGLVAASQSQKVQQQNAAASAGNNNTTNSLGLLQLQQIQQQQLQLQQQLQMQQLLQQQFNTANHQGQFLNNAGNMLAPALSPFNAANLNNILSQTATNANTANASTNPLLSTLAAAAALAAAQQQQQQQQQNQTRLN